MKYLLIATVWILFTGISSAQTNAELSEINAVFSEVTTFTNDLRELKENINDLNTQSNKDVDSITSLINNTILEIGSNTRVPIQYQKSITNMVAFSEQLKDQSSATKDTAIADLLKDLKLKFENEVYSKASLENKVNNKASVKNNIDSMASPTKFKFKLAKVKVETRSNSEPVNDLLIHYSGIGYKINYENPFYTFKKPSSPSEELLSPGYYRFWITRIGNTTKLDERTIEVKPNTTNEIILYADLSQ